MFRCYSVLILVSLILSTSIGVLGDSIHGSSKDEQEVRDLEVIGDEARKFMFYVKLTTDDNLEQIRSCVSRDALDMGAIILSVFRSSFLDFPVSFYGINFLRNESGRRTEEGHRQLRRSRYSGSGCSNCGQDNGDRRELAMRELGSDNGEPKENAMRELGLYTVGDLNDRMLKVLNVAIKQTFLEIRKDSCLSGLNINIETALEFY